MRKIKKRIRIPFWIQILLIIFIGILLSCIVLIISNVISQTNQEVVNHTVTFAYSDGTVIETKTVEEGKGVIPPNIESNSVFRGWSAGFNQVKSDVEVHPVFYNPSEENLFYFDSVYVKEGTKFTLNVYVGGNVDVSNGTLSLNYDTDVLKYKKAETFNISKVSENKSGEITINLDSKTPLKEKTLIAQLTFYAKKKDAYSTHIDLIVKNAETIVAGKSNSVAFATIKNKIYFLQEVGE